MGAELRRNGRDQLSSNRVPSYRSSTCSYASHGTTGKFVRLSFFWPHLFNFRPFNISAYNCKTVQNVEFHEAILIRHYLKCIAKVFFLRNICKASDQILAQISV